MMTNMHSSDSSETQLKDTFLDHSPSDPPRVSSSLLQRIDRIQHGIKATLGGTSKNWLNVQPCVLQGFNSLVELMQNHEKRLCKVDDKLEEMNQTVRILINDRHLKEERYQLDHTMQNEAVMALEKLTQRLQLTLEEERRSRRQLQREVQWLQRDIKNIKRKYHHSLSNGSKTLTGTQATETVGEAQAHSLNKLPESLAQEIHLLRKQWENYRLEQQEERSGCSNKDASLRRVYDNQCCASSGECRKLPFPRQSARWFWMGGGNSHFSEALTRSNSAGGQSISRPIPWGEVQFYDPTTASWYIAQSSIHHDTEAVFSNGFRRKDPAISAFRPLVDRYDNTTQHVSFHRTLCNDQWVRKETVEESPVRAERMKELNCFDWVRPRSIRIAQAGIYKYTTCLLRDTHSSSSFSGGVGTAGESINNEVLVLYVNHRCVVSLGASNSCVLLHANTTVTKTSTGARRSTVPSRRQASSLSAQQRLSFEKFVRQCCEPDQFATSTLSDYIFLPEGAIVQVRCHNMHNSKAIYEAFLELEYIV
ncbi:unnamed protein product [Phytomonas sp. Hart1]|nr:unnamed protein product [Phytomonas sp. Hart1]|eukprot:CCW67593.1 unnamed protein product [Phytomonas sp. isolate Hart1]